MLLLLDATTMPNMGYLAAYDPGKWDRQCHDFLTIRYYLLNFDNREEKEVPLFRDAI